MNTHLSEEEFTERLLGMGSSKAEAHLAECGACREEMARVGAALGMYREAAVEWSERRPVGERLSARMAGKGRKSANAWMPVAGWAVAAGLVVAIGVPVMRHVEDGRQAEASITVAGATGPVSADAISQDNAMMGEINAAIEQPDISPVHEYKIEAKAKGRRHEL